MITTVTMNAALDKAYFMTDEIKNGTVMRVSKIRTTAGGKGLNVARVIALCGAKVQATGLVGGYNGQQLEHLLEQDGIPHSFGYVNGETRCCINILDPGYGSTEYLEPGFTVSPEEEKQFMDRLPQIIQDSDVVTISGSIPRGVSSDVYGKIISLAKGMGKKVILDSSGDTLKAGLRACPDMVKPNRDEMEQLFGEKLDSMEVVIACAEKIQAMGIPHVVVSLGGDGALLVCREGCYRAVIPRLEVVNTVGCGDSMVGAFAVALEKNYPPEKALKYAASVATANALSPNTGDFEPKMAGILMEQITVEKLK